MTSRAVPGTRARLGTGPGALSVDALIAPGDAERAEADANRWIKSLRHARVDGATFRDRFTHRGDSLWWFAEIYLHKRRIIVRALRALYALRQAASEGAFATWDLSGADHVVAHVAAEVARDVRHLVRGHQPWRRACRSLHAGRQGRLSHVHRDGGSPARALRAAGQRKAASPRSSTARSRAAEPARRPTSGRCFAPSSCASAPTTCRWSASGLARASECAAGAIGSASSPIPTSATSP